MTYTETDLVTTIERLTAAELSASPSRNSTGSTSSTPAAPRPSIACYPAWDSRPR